MKLEDLALIAEARGYMPAPAFIALVKGIIRSNVNGASGHSRTARGIALGVHVDGAAMSRKLRRVMADLRRHDDDRASWWRRWLG